MGNCSAVRNGSIFLKSLSAREPDKAAVAKEVLSISDCHNKEGVRSLYVRQKDAFTLEV